MRRIDKKLNMMKANLLAESRYLESKGLIKEEEYLRGDLHTLIGTEMRAEKIADNSGGAKHHVEAYEAAAKATKDFLRQHPEMMDAAEEITDHFSKKLYREGENRLFEEDDLSNYKDELSKTGDYPWVRNAGNNREADRQEAVNKNAKENFEKKINNTYMGQTIETTNGVYAFSNIKYTNNHGNYDLMFTKPKGENDFMDKTLWITYDPTDGYYILYKQGEIQLNDDESKEKVTKMLSYNK